MGYEVGRFEGDVDEELHCPICSGVLEEPVQATQCEHAFCSACIKDWLLRQQTCPIDRGALKPSQLKPVPRILKNLLARLKIACSNQEQGCTAVVKLDMLATHLQECDFNPKKPILCDKGCGLTMPKDQLAEFCSHIPTQAKVLHHESYICRCVDKLLSTFPTHNCVRDLRSLVQQQQSRISSLQGESSELKLNQSELKREVQNLKESMRARLNVAASSVSGPQAEEVARWAASLQQTRVTRWGGMISTPDAVLQASIKRALIDSACPTHIVGELMDNSHERRWPAGLGALEARQLNRRLYDNYVCKRIPGKQAVVVMACENLHMPADMILEPGLVMIFAHGVE